MSMWPHRQRARNAVPWSLRLSAIFPALQTRSLHTLLETDAAEREGRDMHLFPGWSKHRGVTEEQEGTWDGKGKTHLLSDDREETKFYLCCPDSPAQGSECSGS